LVDGVGGNLLNKAQFHRFVGEQAHGPVIMPIRSRTTGNGNEMSGLLAGQGLPPSLLHLIMQHQGEPACDFTLILAIALTHIVAVA
jgi:hypothetical protein